MRDSGTEKCCLQSATHLFPDIIEILRNFSFAASFPPGHFLMSGENFIADRFWKRIRSVSKNMIMQKINFSTCSVISAVQNIFSFPGSATFIEKMKHPYPAGTVQIPASAGLRWHAIWKNGCRIMKSRWSPVKNLSGIWSFLRHFLMQKWNMKNTKRNWDLSGKRCGFMEKMNLHGNVCADWQQIKKSGNYRIRNGLLWPKDSVSVWSLSFICCCPSESVAWSGEE